MVISVEEFFKMKIWFKMDNCWTDATYLPARISHPRFLPITEGDLHRLADLRVEKLAVWLTIKNNWQSKENVVTIVKHKISLDTCPKFQQ